MFFSLNRMMPVNQMRTHALCELKTSPLIVARLASRFPGSKIYSRLKDLISFVTRTSKRFHRGRGPR